MYAYFNAKTISMTKSVLPLTILLFVYWVTGMPYFFSYSVRMFQLETRVNVVEDVESYLSDEDGLGLRCVIML